MKIKAFFFALMVITAIAFSSSCNCCHKPNSSSAGTSLQDTVLPKLLVRLVHSGSVNYLAYYWTNSLVVDTTKSPPTMVLSAQSARYDATNTSSVLHNGTSTSQVTSGISVITDTVHAIYAGPFDPAAGQFYTMKGYLHYVNKLTASTDSVICPISSIVYFGQSNNGQPISIGYVGNGDLHAPKPEDQK